ncbi:fungal-specific transcription factor domain-containing protein [Lactifluus subvellereus]|nr:fungal-specific transcription factor domain-containing protein [Lactifluus subvellereus]
MHQSDLFMPAPLINSRHVPPARPSIGPISDLSQPFSASSISKKRNIERACDDCRRRKTRCDGPKMPDNVCTNCVQNRKICTYLEASKPRGPPKAYVTNLEDRMEKMEALLKRLRPETDFSAELGPPIVRGSWKDEPVPSTSSSASGKNTATRPLHQLPPLSTLAPQARTRKTSSTSLATPSDDDGAASSDENFPGSQLIQSMKRLTLFDREPQAKANRLLDAAYRYHGRSTHGQLVLAAREMRTRYFLESMGVEADIITSEVGRLRESAPGHTHASKDGLRRPEYWRSPDWELAYEGDFTPNTPSGLLQRWPPSDLALTLIDLYFLHCNSMFPLLHRPTFAHHFADRLYEHDIWFACTCMCVFALASRYTDDPRVLLDEPVEVPLEERAGPFEWQTAGFKYYFLILEVEHIKRSMLSPASLFEIQTLCLMAQFQGETRWHRSAWYTVGVGIRKMQDIGAHTKQSYAKAGPSVENELWKRVWWYLNGLDRIQCAILGRPCATRVEDLDVEYPLEVDDEFWENNDPQLAFRQPPDRRSTIAAFNLWLRLTDIAAAASTMHTFDDNEHDGRSSGLHVEENLDRLNESLTEWAEKVPRHLKWTPDIEDVVLANQSATLYTTYNLLMILMQRAFLPSSIALLSTPRDLRTTPPGLAHALTARAVSITAAKAISRILAIVHKRTLSNIPLLLVSAEIAAAVLCIDRWIIKAREGTGPTRDGKFAPAVAQTIESHMQDITSLLAALRWAAPRWETAQEKLAYLEKMVPDVDKEPANLGYASTLDVHSTTALSRQDISYLEPHIPADISTTIVGTSAPRYTHRQEGGPWLPDLPRQYIPPQETSAQAIPRISTRLSIPRTRANSSAEQPQRPIDDWSRSHMSYSTLSLPLTTPGQLHSALETDFSSEFTRVKHEPDGDPSIPPLRLGWAYENRPLPPAHVWEDSPGRGSQYNGSATRSTGSSLLSHLYRSARDHPATLSHGTSGAADRSTIV